MVKKYTTKILTALMILGFGTPSFSQLIKTPVASEAATVSQVVGVTNITISYSRPLVNGRTIWGSNIVPYGYKSFSLINRKAENPWRAGANEPTVIDFEHDVEVNGNPLKAGKYSLSMAVHENGEVDIIFNKDIKSWGSFYYDSKKDVLRVKVRSEKLDAHQEALEYEFYSSPGSAGSFFPKPGSTLVGKSTATIALKWENKKIPFKVEIDTPNIIAQSILEDQSSNTALFNRVVWTPAAAIFFMNNKIHLEEAVNIMTTYVGKANAISTNPMIGNFANITTLGNLLLLSGKKEEAKKYLDAAFALDPASIGANTAGFYVWQAISLELPDELFQRAIKFFEDNFSSHARYVYYLNLGYANYYNSKGDYKTAVVHINKISEALKNANTRLQTLFQTTIKTYLDNLNNNKSMHHGS